MAIHAHPLVTELIKSKYAPTIVPAVVSNSLETHCDANQEGGLSHPIPMKILERQESSIFVVGTETAICPIVL
ncbi:MAG: hypothetical protein ACK56W_03830 [Pirellula sp.]|nr:hypothetical protein [Pirellula sp.]